MSDPLLQNRQEAGRTEPSHTRIEGSIAGKNDSARPINDFGITRDDARKTETSKHVGDCAQVANFIVDDRDQGSNSGRSVASVGPCPGSVLRT